MSGIARHGGVLILLMAAAAAASWFMPISMSSEPYFLAAIVLFIAYLGVSLFLGKAKGKPASNE